MKTRLSTIAALIGLVALGTDNYASAQATITQWSFDTIGVQSAPNNSPAPSTGVGTAITLGMTNNYVNGAGTANTASDDVVKTNGLSPSTFVENAWRVRGTPNNGWANAAPQYSQGIELDTSTVGYYNVAFSFDWYCTTFGIRDLQFQYNLNVSNSAGWTNYGGASPTGTYTATSDDWYGGAGTSTPMITVPLSSISGANNDPNFGIRLVSAYDSTGNLGNTYAGAQLLSSGSTQIYNNTSGNWRFDNLTFLGSPGLAPLQPPGTPVNNVTWALTGSVASGAWDTSTANWNAVPPTGSNVQYVDDGTYGVTFPDFGSNGTATVTTMSGGVGPAAITVSNSTGTYDFTGGFIGGGGTLGLLKQNGGVAILSASNTYTGGTSIFGGTLVVNGGDNRLGASDGANGVINIDGGATLQVAGANLISTRNINVYNDGGGTIDTNSWNASTSGNVVVVGPLTKAGSGDLTLSGNNIIFSGSNALLTINSGGSVTFAGSGTTSFGGGGQFDGNLIVTGLPRLNFDNSMTGGTGEIQIKSAGVLTGSNASTSNQWVLLSNSMTNAGLVTSAGTIANNIHLNSGNAAFTKSNVAQSPFSLQTTNHFIVGIGGNPSGTVFAVAGSIYGNSDVVLGSTDQSGIGGSGTLLLAGTNTYSGTTIMAGNGVVQLGSAAALPSNTDVIFGVTSSSSSATLDLNGNSPLIGSLSQANTNSSKFSITNSMPSSTATLTICGTTSPANPFGGKILDGAGVVAISKSGASAFWLSGVNTYSGGTTISGGILQVSNSATGSGLVNVNNGGLLATSAGLVTLNSPVAVNSGGELLRAGFNTGSGTLAVLGGVTLNGGSVVNFDYDQSPSARNMIIAGTGGIAFGGSAQSVGINFYEDPQTVMAGIVPLFSWSGSSNFASQLYLNSFNGTLPSNTGSGDFSFQPDNSAVVNALRGTAAGSGNPDQIDLFNNKLPIPAYLTWSPSGATGTWSTSSTNTVWSSSTRKYFQNNDAAYFADYKSSSSTVTIDAGGISASGVFLTSNTTAYTFTGGPIGGYFSLNKSGSGVVILASPNSYTDGTQITGGTLVTAAGDSSLGASSSAVQLDNGGTLMAGAAGLTSSRDFEIGVGGTGVGGTFDTSASTCMLNGTVSVTGTFSKAGAGFLTLANTKLSSTVPSVLNVSAGTLQIINSIDFSSSGSLSIQGGATAMFDNTNGTLSSVDMKNGATINGNLVIPAAMTVNFDNGNFAGAGQIQVQDRTSQTVLTNSGSGANGTISVNIHLNSLGDNTTLHPFTKYDVTQTNPILNGPNSAVATIGGGGGATQSEEQGVNFVISGVISGNSDVNFSTDGVLGGGQGSVELAGANTYAGATLINWNGNGNSNSGRVRIDVDNALPTTTDVIFNTLIKASNSVLDLNGHNQQIASLSSGQVVNGTNSIENNGTSPSVLTISGTTTPANGYRGLLADGVYGAGGLSLVKAGPNTLTITGTNNGYTGNTTLLGGGLVFSPVGGQGDAGHYSIISPNMYVTGGTLSGDAYLGTFGSNNGISLGTNLIVGASGTVNPGIPGSSNPGTLSVYGGASFAAGSKVGFDFGVAGNSELNVGAGAGGALGLPSSGAVTIKLTNEGSVSGTVPLFTFGSLVGSTSSLAIGSAPTGYTYSFSSSPSEIDLTLTRNAAANLTWSGSVSNAWDVNTTANFAGPQTFASTAGTDNGDQVIFDDSGNAGSVAIAPNGVAPSSVVFNNRAKSYDLTGGPITGSTSLVLSGGGPVTLDNANTYTGGTFVSSGTLTLDSPAALEDGTSLTVGNASTFNAVGGNGESIAGRPTAVPEPGTFVLLTVGLALIALGASRRRTN